MVVSLKKLQQRLEMEVDLELELSVGGSFRKPKMDSDSELRSCDRSEDAKAKREIQAMRRQEAKRKREEKKKGMRNGGGGGGGGDAERMRLEAQRLQSRVKDRERRENDEAALSHRKSDIENRNQGLVEGSIQMMVPIQCAYPPRVQYVPLAFPCMVPYWAPAAGIQPVKPIPSRGGRSVLSEGWTNSSPSVSPQDGGSSDPQSSSSDGQGQSEPCVSSYHKASSSQGNQNSSEKSTTCGDKDRTSKLNSSIGESISSPRKKTTGKRTGDSGDKPKKAGNQNQNQTAPPNSLEQMPCVSTTGNGPNGKTITGLLYRYTKTEICIVCVCHGSSFSPAGFVEHAGGVDVSQPLKHITVIPSAFP